MNSFYARVGVLNVLMMIRQRVTANFKALSGFADPALHNNPHKDPIQIVLVKKVDLFH